MMDIGIVISGASQANKELVSHRCFIRCVQPAAVVSGAKSVAVAKMT